jgi:hypothetical protein
MSKPNETTHIDWIQSCYRADAVYEYPKLSIEECETMEAWVIEMLGVYEPGNEQVDVAELLCNMISIFASRNPKEQQGILISALRKSADIHDELWDFEKGKLKKINKLLNSKNKKKD